MTQPEKSFENPIFLDDGSEEEALLKSRGNKSTPKTSLPDIEVEKSKPFSGKNASSAAPKSLPPIEEVQETDSDSGTDEESEDSLDLVNQLLEDFGNENLDDEEVEDGITLEDDDDDDGISLEDDDELDESDYSEEGIVDIDPEILRFLQEVNLDETDNEEEDWFIDDIDGDEDEGSDEFTFAPLENEEPAESESPRNDELFEEFATIAADDEEDTLHDDEFDDTEDVGEEFPEESSPPKNKSKLKEKLAAMKENIRSEIGDGGKKKEEKPNEEDDETKNPGILSKIHGFFLNILLKIANVLSKLPVIGKFFEPTEKLMIILGRIAYFVPLILLIVILLLTNNMAINKTEVHDLPDEGQVTVQNVEYNKEDNTVEAEMMNTGSIIAESRVDFSVKSTQFSLNPLHWFTPQEVTTCSSDWVSVDLGDIQDITASCEEKEIAGFWFRGSIEVVE